MDSSDWSNGIRHHTFDTRPDTKFHSHLDVYAKSVAKDGNNRKNELATKREQDAIAAMPRQLRASL